MKSEKLRKLLEEANSINAEASLALEMSPLNSKLLRSLNGGGNAGCANTSCANSTNNGCANGTCGGSTNKGCAQL